MPREEYEPEAIEYNEGHKGLYAAYLHHLPAGNEALSQSGIYRVYDTNAEFRRLIQDPKKDGSYSEELAQYLSRVHFQWVQRRDSA